MRNLNKKLSSYVLTIFIISILILAGPASAFTLSVTPDRTKANVGENVSFLASVDIENYERLALTTLNLKLPPSSIDCDFYPNASIISGCENLTIDLVDSTSYDEGNLTGNYSNIEYNWGYGYGYSSTPGILSYNITLNSSLIGEGVFNPTFKIRVANNSFEKINNLTIIIPINITDLAASNLCAFENDNITLSANITGSIEAVILQTNISGTIANHTLVSIGDIYSASASSSGQQNLGWRFIVQDISGDWNYGAWNLVYVRMHTNIATAPINADGLNGWYVTEPIFSLIRDSAGGNIYYRWDADQTYNYAAPFNLDNIPNSPPKNSSGTLGLNWWTDFGVCGNETEQTQTFKVDLTSPSIINLEPDSDSVVYNNLRSTIQAYLDEVYQSNSGINKLSVIMQVNGVNVTPNVFSSGSLDAIVRYNPTSDLLVGTNNVSVFVSDNAGRQSNLSWSFYINTSLILFNLTINNPQNGSYNSKRVPINLSTQGIANKIEILNINDSWSRYRTLCRNCNSYGLINSKTQTVNEGTNTLVIRASDNFGNSIEQNISLFVDSKEPRISQTKPTRNKVTNGTEFYIKYTEDSLKNISLIYGNALKGYSTLTKNSTECLVGKNQECLFTNVNLSAYESQVIEYWFTVKDSINTVESKKTQLRVDTLAPVIVSFANQTLSRNRLKLTINITETNFDDITYVDYNSFSTRPKTLCSSLKNNACVKTLSFKGTDPNLVFTILDKAGNSAIITL